jgi:hypothetical protein
MKKNIFSKKIIFAFLALILILPFFVRPAKAFETPTVNYGVQFEEALATDEMNLQSFVNETVKAVAASLNKLVMGKVWDKEGREKDPGLLGVTTSLIVGLYNTPPASGVQYLAHIGQRLGVTKQAYAEEGLSISGFHAMELTLPLWTAFRNISYLLLVLLLVGMGFAIMFRLKISPQAVITIQSALPKIVLALILITFSYAIVGAMLDIVFFLCKVIGQLFTALFIDNIIENGRAFWSGMTDLFGSGASKGGIAMSILTANSVVLIAAPALFMFALQFLLPVGIILQLVVGILLLIAFFRTLWVLIRTFAMIVISLVFGPFQILIGVLPGTNAMASWFKNLVAQMAVLPIMLAMLFLGSYLILAGTMNALSQFLGESTKVMADLAHFQLKEAIGKVTEGVALTPFYLLTALIFPFAGLFILLLIPKVADIIQSVITKKPFQYGTAIGETISAPGKAVSSMYGFATRAAEGALTVKKVRDQYRKDVPKVDANKDGKNDMPLIE